MSRVSLTVAGVEFRNPILSASGTYGHGLEMQYMSDPASLGGLVSKSVSLRPRRGNPTPRICETEMGFLNSIGLENRGLEHYLEHTLPDAAAADTRIVTNIVGEGDAGEYAEIAAIQAWVDQISNVTFAQKAALFLILMSHSYQYLCS